MIIKHWTKRRIVNDAGEFINAVLGFLSNI